MASRPHAGPMAVLDSSTGQSMSGSLTSRATIIQDLSMLSYAVSWSGSSPAGNISVQVSNDFSLNADGSIRNQGTWNTVPVTLNGTNIATQIPISGNSGNGFIDIDQNSAYAMRLVYAAGSGSGTLSAVVNAKVA